MSQVSRGEVVVCSLGEQESMQSVRAVLRQCVRRKGAAAKQLAADNGWMTLRVAFLGGNSDGGVMTSVWAFFFPARGSHGPGWQWVDYLSLLLSWVCLIRTTGFGDW